LLVGGTGPVGQASIPHLLDAGHRVAVAHTGAHEPPGLGDVEHLHGDRPSLLAAGGTVDRWRPGVLVDTFAGAATAAKATELGALAASRRPHRPRQARRRARLTASRSARRVTGPSSEGAMF
jgi:uncharacterized protein YbjT (DUF2867 family)